MPLAWEDLGHNLPRCSTAVLCIFSLPVLFWYITGTDARRLIDVIIKPSRQTHQDKRNVLIKTIVCFKQFISKIKRMFNIFEYKCIWVYTYAHCLIVSHFLLSAAKQCIMRFTHLSCYNWCIFFCFPSRMSLLKILCNISAQLIYFYI